MFSKFIPEIAKTVVDLHLSLEDTISSEDLNTKLLVFGVSSTHEDRQSFLDYLCQQEYLKFVTTAKGHDGVPYKRYTSITPRKEYEETFSLKLYFYNETIPVSYLQKVLELNRSIYQLQSASSEAFVKEVKISSVETHEISINSKKIEVGVNLEFNTTRSIKKELEQNVCSLIDIEEDFILGNLISKSAKRTFSKWAVHYECLGGNCLLEIGKELRFFNLSFKILFVVDNYMIIEMESHFSPVEMLIEFGSPASLYINEDWKLVKDEEFDLATYNLLKGRFSTPWSSRSTIKNEEAISYLAEAAKANKEKGKRSPKVPTDGITVIGETLKKDSKNLIEFLTKFDKDMFVLFNKVRACDSTSPVIVISHLEESKHDRMKLFYRKTYGSHNYLQNISCRKIGKLVAEIIDSESNKF